MIQTARLTIKPRLVDRDVEKEVNWLNDPYVMRYSEQRHRKHTIESQIAYISSFSISNDKLLYEIRKDGLLIGSISAIIDRNNLVANMGILIGDAHYWDQGFGSEAWIAFSDHLIKDHGVMKLEAGCMEPNFGMIRLAKNSGMKLEGVKYDHFIYLDHRAHRMEFGKVA
jgi:[ribosomal protein S5]-alanine N-acetyltransferase